MQNHMFTFIYVYIYLFIFACFFPNYHFDVYDLFYITRFIGTVENAHAFLFLLDIVGIVIMMSLTLTQVCW